MSVQNLSFNHQIYLYYDDIAELYVLISALKLYHNFNTNGLTRKLSELNLFNAFYDSLIARRHSHPDGCLYDVNKRVNV